MSENILLSSLDDTRKLAVAVGSRLRCGDVVTLAGDLGAGKTTFAQFLIGGLSLVPVEVTSPTFNLLQTYDVKLGDDTHAELYHYDLYRIEHPSALTELGLEEAVEQVAIIEWPDRLAGARIPVALALSFTIGEDGARSVAVQGGARWSELSS
jgi:tRNA threonylcarbamoyl adenosine modification protein YjeE